MKLLEKLIVASCIFTLYVVNIYPQASWTMGTDAATLSPSTANIGIGTAPLSTAKLRIYNNNSSSTGTLYGLYSTMANTNASQAGSVYGSYSTVSNSSTSATGVVYGSYLSASNSNTSSTIYGLYSSVTGGSASKRWAGYFNGGNVAIMSGNLGIGTSTPQESLDVNGNVIFRGNSTTISGVTQTEKLLVNHPTTVSNWNTLWQSGFYDSQNAAYAPESSGWFWGINIGHSANNPNYRYGGQIAILNNNVYPAMYFRSKDENGEGVWAKVLYYINDKLAMDLQLPAPGDIKIGATGDQGNRLRLHHNDVNAYIDFSPNLIFRGGDDNLNTSLYLTSNGNVGIGLNPGTKLDVAGVVRAHEVKVCLNQGCDFVFEEDYDLMSISETAEFIKTNKHLPHVAPAREMESDGINVSEMSALLLRKIEELTLYVIELEKKNSLLESRLDALVR